jgi:GNAT superfamily N-acetyltransferase
MRSEALLVNAARGAIVDTESLVEHLQVGRQIRLHRPKRTDLTQRASHSQVLHRVCFDGRMDLRAVREAFDEQMRRSPKPVAPNERIERDDRVVRVISDGDGWSGVTWCDLDETSADGVIASQIDRFAELSRPWEWKHYSYDQPADLPERLCAIGFTPDPAEALLVGEAAGLPVAVPLPSGLALVPVLDEQGVSSFVSVNDEVFGGSSAWIGRRLLADLARQPSTAPAVLAMAAQTPVGALRLEFAPETDFAVLFSACTLPAWRSRGVFRSLLAYAVSLAADRGFRYLQTDAFPDSRPILKRLGFVELGTTTPFIYPGGAPRVEGGEVLGER